VRTSGALFVLTALAVSASAAPTADLVVVWAPGSRIAPIEGVARRHGAAVIDKTPAPLETARTGQLLQQGIDAYGALDLDTATKSFGSALSDVDRTGAAGLTRAQLSDLFLYRALVAEKLGDATTVWDELLKSAIVSPTRDLDPARFSPRLTAQHARAKDTVQKGAQARLDIQAPPGCAVTVDGETALGPVERPVGPHWFRVTCPDRAPFGQRFELTSGAGAIPITPPPYAPPSDTELLIQARSVGARAMIVAEVHDQVATLRLVGIDGRERDRRSVSVSGELGPLADAIGDMLTPPGKAPWYHSRWAYAGGAAALAALIAVPITALIVGGGHSTTADAMFKGLPPL
jgi:hypothetical protein